MFKTRQESLVGSRRSFLTTMFLAALLVATSAHAKAPEDLLKGTIIASDSGLPLKWSDVGTYVSQLKKLNRSTLTYDKKTQSLNLNLGIFFAAPIDDIQVYLAFYDITDGEAKKTKVFGSELFLGKRGDRVLFTSATISNENVPMNKKYLIAVESKNKIVARTEVTIKGTAPKYSGTVEFNDGEGSK